MSFRSLFCLLLLLATHRTTMGQPSQAVPGVPFGVGKITLNLPVGVSSEVADTRFFSIEEARGRVHYPAIRLAQPLGAIRELLGVPIEEDSKQLHIHFLFTGTEPLELTLHAPEPRTITIVPGGRRPAYGRLLRAWWIRYKQAARNQGNQGDYAPLVETYLTSMLARRMNLELPRAAATYGAGESLEMILGTEKLRIQMLRDTLMGKYQSNEISNQPLPPPIQWPTPSYADEFEANVEPIARHVPHECFYVRFAQFPNYLWLRRLLEEYGGDLSRMVMLRGTEPNLNVRVEQQLGLRETQLAVLLGEQVISDVAMIGRDTYLHEGAAIGILFEAKNDVMISGDLQNQRRQRVQELKELGITATMTTVEIEGKDVSFAATADHQLRSFYVQDGKYHLVTNCEEIARRFLQCGKGVNTLGDSPEFRHARQLNPLAEDNTIFVYLSRAFFEGLLSPQYQIELSRRLQSVTNAGLLQLAGLAARGEGLVEYSADQLVDDGFLTSKVDQMHDGSTIHFHESSSVDSHRGRRGTFLPIPDMPIDGVTLSEVARFNQVDEFHRRSWPQMDPVLIGLRRTALDDDIERVQIEVRMLPINHDKYGALLDMIGPPTRQIVVPPEDDIVSVQAFLDGGKGTIPPHHLFFGIRDAVPRGDVSERRLLKSLQILRTAPAYLGAFPKPWLLDRFGLHGRPTGDGMRRMILGLFRYDAPNGFSLLSFDRNILAEVAPLLSMAEAEDEAQARIHVGDVKQSKFGQWANDLDFQRAWETSVGNVRLMHLMTQQLKVPKSEAKDVVEQLLDAKLVCPLDGEYGLLEESGQNRWVSSAWVDGKYAAHADYVSPLMNWLRGLDATAVVEADRVVAQGTLDIQRSKKAEEGGIKLPLFDMFGGFGKGKTKASESIADEAPAGQQSR